MKDSSTELSCYRSNERELLRIAAKKLSCSEIRSFSCSVMTKAKPEVRQRASNLINNRFIFFLINVYRNLDIPTKFTQKQNRVFQGHTTLQHEQGKPRRVKTAQNTQRSESNSAIRGSWYSHAEGMFVYFLNSTRSLNFAGMEGKL